MKRETLDALATSRATRRPLVRLLWLDSGKERIIAPDSTSSDEAGADLPAALSDGIAAAIRSDRAALVESNDGPVFIHPISPALRLAIVGAVHIAQRLARLAIDLGYDVTIIDPRRGFLTEKRFPGTTRSHEWPDVALEAFAPDARSAVVTLSHDSKIDEPALEVALRSSCFYVGALGSRRTQAKRRDRLREAGLAEDAIAKIHGPVGLDLGAKSPAEIALSIAAEMTATLRSLA